MVILHRQKKKLLMRVKKKNVSTSKRKLQSYKTQRTILNGESFDVFELIILSFD